MNQILSTGSVAEWQYAKQPVCVHVLDLSRKSAEGWLTGMLFRENEGGVQLLTIPLQSDLIR